MTVLEYINLTEAEVSLNDGLTSAILSEQVISARTFKRGGYVRLKTDSRTIRFYMSSGALYDSSRTQPVEAKGAAPRRGRRAKSSSGLTQKRTFRMTPEAIQTLVEISQKTQMSQPDIITYGLSLIGEDVTREDIQGAQL